MRKRSRLLPVALVTVLTAASGFFLTVSADAAVPPTPTGWTLAFADDFNGANNTLPSGANWIIDTGTSYPGGPANWGTGEIQSYTNSTANLRQDGTGNLVITPIRNGSSWTSARIETQRSNFTAPAGGVLRIEGRIQMPNVTGAAALGYWPAFWALGAPYRGNWWNWPGIGEFDIMENVNGINAVWGVLHCGVSPGGPCNETTGLGANRACPGSSCQSAFHTYRFEWDRTNENAQQLRWYVDGTQFHTVNQSQVGASWAQMTNHAGYFILLNVAMGGAFPNALAGTGTPTGSTASGVPMRVDYVAVWTRGGGGQPPSSPPPSSPPPSGNRDAYTQIQAESFNAQSGLVNYGAHIGSIGNGNWARYDGVNFGSSTPRDFVARVASGAAGGVSGLVEVRIDSPTAPPIGSFAIANTGGWTSWREVPGNVAAVTGTHSVYLTFTSGQPADFVDVDWFLFRH
ncbi:endo-1,3-beta-glucanase [Rhizocola hellebori]|uniref:Endo-1,3-beta-glucanase n=1 Tax=Rhizocola hellebori TaxID=1392758 RepID=A0A8J3QDP6_9ACTN|nr:glycoside hydrolase family 16 protein [Rhizocola hellebori]GIH08864.1 endo-1,3-beta-glucanase [Rhizocola hellebori]